MLDQLWQLAQPLLVLFGAYLTARFAYRAEERRSQTQRETAEIAAMAQLDVSEIQSDATAGELALQIARSAEEKADRAHVRLEKLDKWRRQVEFRWWPQHERVDQAILEELEKLDPSAVGKLPMPPVFPVYEDS